MTTPPPLLAKTVNDIRFWILLYFLLHLSAIAVPPLEPGSTWRQTDGLIIARNFYEHSHNILYPTTDVAGEKSGIVGCEFPVLNYLIYLLSVVFGYHSWLGRLINLVVSCVGVYFFYKLIEKYFTERAAFYAAIVLMASIWFTYVRTNIPDTFGASLCLVALYYGMSYLEEKRPYQLVVFTVFAALGGLSKISALCVLSILVLPFFFGKSSVSARVWLAVGSCVVLGLVSTWYFVWVPYLTEQFQFTGHFFMGMPLRAGAMELLDHWRDALRRIYDTTMKYTGFVVFVGGLMTLIYRRQVLVLAVFLMPVLAFSVVIFGSGYNFILNPYYVAMLAMPMSFVAGWGLAQLPRAWMAVLIVVAIAGEGIGNQIHVFHIREPYTALTHLEAALDSVSNRDDLIAINGTAYGDPTPMYMAHRHGWVEANDFFTPAAIDDLRAKHCRFIVIAKTVYGDVNLDLPVAFDSEDFKIYKL